jgi:hypothetical protein
VASIPKPNPIETQEAEIHVDAPEPSVPAPVAVTPTASKTSEPSKREGRGGILVALLLVALLGGGAYYYFGLGDPLALVGGNPGNMPDSPPTLNVPRENAEVTLTYNGELFVIHNGGDYDLTELERLTFVRGERGTGGDDFSGDRIPSDTITTDTCYRIQLLNSTPQIPAVCGSARAFEELSNTALFHWRSDDGTFAFFDVMWDDDLLVRCNTVQRGIEDTCTFRFPLANPDAE